MHGRVLYFLIFHILKTATPQTLRLLSPLDNGVGRLEVYYNGSWGTICDDHFNTQAAMVACRQLGRYYAGFQSKDIQGFGFGSGKIWLDDVRCTGTESSLWSCSHNPWGQHNCGHHEDVGVICDERSVTVKLTPGYKSGLLQVYHNNIWGIVCDDGFGKVGATVVCRTLGYDSGEETDKNSAIKFWLDDVYCTMNNTDIRDCRHREWGSHNCAPSEAVGINCYSFPEDSTASRMVPYNNVPGTGRVELYYEGEWGSVCSDGIGTEVASVICRMLGYDESGTRITSGVSSGTGPKLLKDVNCKGTEINLSDCSHSPWTVGNCSSPFDLGVKCYSALDMERGVRLISSTQGAGRVEILHNRVWGTVCGMGFTVREARVVCRMANLPWSAAYVSSSYGPGGGVIWLSGVNCIGNETSLDQCSHNIWGASTCSHSQDVGVVCVGAMLSSGGSDTQGRLEMFYDNQWGTVCDVGFTNMSAKVACSMLGQSSKHAYYTSGETFGPGTGRIWLSDVRCDGSEDSLGKCSHLSWGIYNPSCSHSRDVGVVCSYPPTVHLEPRNDTIDVDVGCSLVVECVIVDANPAVQSIVWAHNGRTASGNTYRIQSMSKSDRGNLSCTADNGLGMTPGRVETVINVLYPPEIHLDPELEIIKILDGKNITVNCIIDDANPPVKSFLWSHNGRVSSGATFHIQSVSQSDEGRLTCTAENGVGISNGRADTFIRVLVAEGEIPEVRLDPDLDIIKTEIGENLTVNCMIDDVNPPVTSIKWSHNGRVNYGVTFHIQSVSQSDEGRLTCTADNGVGSPGHADAFIRVLVDSTAITEETSKWTAIHTAAAITGAGALIIVVLLAVVIIHLFRKLHQKSEQTEKKRKQQQTVGSSNPIYEAREAEPVYENTNSVYESPASNRESIHLYESIVRTAKPKTEEAIYVNTTA